jgi:hypothetical protein
MAIAILRVGLQLKECEGLPQVKHILTSEFEGETALLTLSMEKWTIVPRELKSGL